MLPSRVFSPRRARLCTSCGVTVSQVEMASSPSALQQSSYALCMLSDALPCSSPRLRPLCASCALQFRSVVDPSSCPTPGCLAVRLLFDGCMASFPCLPWTHFCSSAIFSLQMCISVRKAERSVPKSVLAESAELFLFYCLLFWHG